MEALQAYSQMVKQEIAKTYGDTTDNNIQRWKDNLRLSQFGTVDMKETKYPNSKGLI
jgi:hypothetical protein